MNINRRVKSDSVIEYTKPTIDTDSRISPPESSITNGFKPTPDKYTGWRSPLLICYCFSDDCVENPPDSESCEADDSVHSLPFTLRQHNLPLQATPLSFFSGPNILNLEMASLLMLYVPSTFTTSFGGCKLAFATHRDGWAFASLYALTLYREPCVVLMRAKVSQAVFGVYVGGTISPPRPSRRGNGEGFCFRLSEPCPGRYVWTPPSLDNSSTEDTVSSQIAVCTPEYMVFGASQGGGNAIYVAKDFELVSSEASQTYSNPPLVPEESDKYFSVDEVEVYCGSTVMRKRNYSE
mmetsp:Transcript_16117/g.24298  ORF Transcript_16117/g.24298 Transcript_16117/m.24298 type:complete len:294 (+) Transcript_16117:111-992(+)